MTVENISWSISTKECCRPRRGLNPRPPGLQSDGASNWATEASKLYGREYDQGKVTYNDIYFQQKSIWPIFSSFFFPEIVTGRWQDWGKLDYTGSHKIWVSLISITKWQETSVNKCHEHILLIIFIICYWFTYIFIYWYSILMMLRKTFEETTDRSVLCSHLGWAYFHNIKMAEGWQWKALCNKEP